MQQYSCLSWPWLDEEEATLKSACAQLIVSRDTEQVAMRYGEANAHL